MNIGIYTNVYRVKGKVWGILWGVWWPKEGYAGIVMLAGGERKSQCLRTHGHLWVFMGKPINTSVLSFRDQGVGGSNPLSPTKLFIISNLYRSRLLLSLRISCSCSQIMGVP